jgi:LPXTG-motif cell wall-anchored protein
MRWSGRRLLIGPLMLAGAMAASPVLAGPASASARIPAYGPGACSVSVSISPKPPIQAGSTVTISLSGTCGSRSFTVTLHPDGTVLGTITTGASGSGSGAVTIPASVSSGSHTIVVSDAVGNSGAIAITVLSGTPAASGTGGHGSLPLTGTDATALGAVGAGAIGLGGLIVLGSRRRRAANFR